MRNTTSILLLLATLAITSSLSSCDQKKEVLAPVASVDVPVIQNELPKRILSPDELQSAFEVTFEKSHIKDEGDGIQTFSACFEVVTDGKKCKHISLAKRDGFKKATYLQSGIYSAINLSDPIFTYVCSYIAVIDGKYPKLVLAPVYTGNRSWLFMKSVSIMVDGDVVIEHEFKHEDVRRDTSGGSSNELSFFDINEEQIDKLRKISGKNVLIRITGEKNYSSVSPENIKRFVEEINNALFIYDRINASIDEKKEKLTS